MPSRLEDVADLRHATTDGALFTAFATLTGGAILTSLIKHVAENDRAADYWIALVGSLPSMLGLLGIFGAIYGRQFPYFRKLIKPFGWTIRLALFPLIGIALWSGPPSIRLPLILLCVVLSGAAGQMIGPIYNDWMAELVPVNSRGWYFSRRNAIASVVGASAGLAGGWFIDLFRRQQREDIGYAVVFSLAAALSLVSMAYFLRMRERVRQHPIKSTLKEGILAIRTPFRDQMFRRVILFLAVFVFGQAFPGSIFAPYCLESLRMPLASIQLLGLVQAATIISFAKIWGFLADKYGNKPILAVLAVGLGFTPFMWVLTEPGYQGNLAILLVGHILSGFVWAGIGTCQFNLLLATADPEDRANYMGSAMAIQAVIAGVAPLAGMACFRWFVTGSDPSAAYQSVIWLSILLRFGSVLFLLPVREEGATTIGAALSQLRRISPTGYRAMHELRTSPDVETREHAMDRLADRQFGVATDELIRALRDPAPRVRRKAAQALSRVGEEEAARALIRLLEDHPDLADDEMIEALGDIGHPEAGPILMRYLNSPRPQLRRAAAKALGDLGATEFIPALMAAAQDASDPDLRRAALQGLRLNMSEEAHPVLSAAVLDSRPSVRIAAAEAISEHGITSAREALRQSLEQFQDEASSEVAYALGSVGEEVDVPLLLQSAKRCTSAMSRRRCLLGIARLWGMEAETYRMFLLNGMSRDSALLDRVRPALRRSKKLQTALARFSVGNEEGALNELATSRIEPRLKILGETPVIDAFFLAAELYTRATLSKEQK